MKNRTTKSEICRYRRGAYKRENSPCDFPEPGEATLKWDKVARNQKHLRDIKGHITPKDAKDILEFRYEVRESRQPREATPEEVRANNTVAVETVCGLIENVKSWTHMMSDELESMNRRKVGSPFRYCDSMILWMMTLCGYLNLTVRMAAGLGRAILGLIGIRAPSYSQFFDRAMAVVGGPDVWEEGGKHILCRYAMSCRNRRRTRRVGVDSSGLNLSCVFRHREHKWKTKVKDRGWLKLHALFDVDSGELLAYVLTDETVGDSTMLPELLRLARDAGYRMNVCFADGAYSGQKNWGCVCDEMGMKFVTAFKCDTKAGNTGGCIEMSKAKKLWCRMRYADWLEMSGYGTRWKLECGFSDFKRVISESVRARTEQGMVREMLGKAIGYDVHKGIRAELVGVTGNGVEIG